MFRLEYDEPYIYVYDNDSNVVHRAIYMYKGQTSYFEHKKQAYVLVVNNYAVVCKMENVSQFVLMPDPPIHIMEER